MKKLEQLKKQRSELDVQIRDIEDKELTEKCIPVLKRNIGKCLVYVNSYGGSSEKWNLYYRILGVDSDGNYIVDSFQNCSDGRIEIEHNRIKHNYQGNDSFSSSDYREISIDDYQMEQRNFLKIIKKVLT